MTGITGSAKGQICPFAPSPVQLNYINNFFLSDFDFLYLFFFVVCGGEMDDFDSIDLRMGVDFGTSIFCLPAVGFDVSICGGLNILCLSVYDCL
jgi:hypothetical protein